MPHGSCQVVGLIEIDDAVRPVDAAETLRPHPRPTRRTSFGRCSSRLRTKEVEIVQANLDQINADLRSELARFLGRT